MDVCRSKGKPMGQNVPEMSHRPGFSTAKQPPPMRFPGGSDGKESAFCVGGVQSLEEDPREEEMATHSSILAWRIPWTEEPGGLQSMG